MRDLLDGFRSIILETSERLLRFDEAAAGYRRAAGKWSRKEILGHLVDSAANNHQRFVRAALAAPLEFPGYEQERWVSAQGYDGESWADLVQLWRSYNLHLHHVMMRIPGDRKSARCVIGGKEPVTLEWLMRDYVRHLRHHLEQIFA